MVSFSNNLHMIMIQPKLLVSSSHKIIICMHVAGMWYGQLTVGHVISGTESATIMKKYTTGKYAMQIKGMFFSTSMVAKT